MKIKFIHVAMIIVLAGVVYFAFSYLEKNMAGGMRGTIIKTPAGDLRLVYKDSAATLNGQLSRSTPCVDWEVKTTTMNNNPLPSETTFEINDANKGVVCIQSLGTPQVIKVEVKNITAYTHYTLKMEGEIVWSGALMEVSLPGAPTSGTVYSH